jgi:hypothetical protein
MKMILRRVTQQERQRANVGESGNQNNHCAVSEREREIIVYIRFKEQVPEGSVTGGKREREDSV